MARSTKSKELNRLDQYFATLPTDEIGGELSDRVEYYYHHLQSIRRMELWRRIYQEYFAGYHNRGRVAKVGKQREKRRLNVNHFQNILQHLLVLTIDNRPAFEPRATNTDHKSQSQTLLARGLLEYYMREKRLEDVIMQSVDSALKYGEGWIYNEWDETKGEDYSVEPEENEQEDPETLEADLRAVIDKEDAKEQQQGEEIEEEEQAETLLKEGDIRYTHFNPANVIRDVTEKDVDNCEWFILRRFVNKFELAARYPEQAEDIKTETEERDISNIMQIDEEVRLADTDLIELYTFIHKKTAAVPEGRIIEFINSDVILHDGVMEYRDFPLKVIMPQKQDNTPFGYTIAFDLLPVSDVIRMLFSTITTNQNTFGVQTIAAPKMAGVSSSQIAEGLNLIEYNGDKKPESMNLTQTPKEIFNFLEMAIHNLETISGVNSVTRGNPEASLKSGAALALVQSMTIQFSSGLQNSYSRLLEDEGTVTIKILQQFANTPRLVAIAGKSKRSYMKEFKGEDLQNISRVMVDMGNPLSRTLAGRENIAKDLLNSGLIKTPEEYFTVLNTGTIEPMYEGEISELMLIRAENEDFSEGKERPVVLTDSHRLHIVEHKTVLSSPESREDQNVTSITLSHILQHIQALKTADPALLQLLGEQSLAPPPMPMGPPPPGGPGGPPPEMPQGPPTPDDAQGMPSMPTNPLSGEKFNPETGGLPQ